MDYKIITIPAGFSYPESEHILITREDGSMESFPVDETNPRYLQFLEEIA